MTASVRPVRQCGVSALQVDRKPRDDVAPAQTQPDSGELKPPTEKLKAAPAAPSRVNSAAPPPLLPAQQQPALAAAAPPSTSSPQPQPGRIRLSVCGRPADPCGWFSGSLVTCCRGRECAGYSQAWNGRFRAARMSVAAIVRQNLYCPGCQNVFCAACKADHTRKACLGTQKGSLTQEQLLAAVSIRAESDCFAAGSLCMLCMCEHHQHIQLLQPSKLTTQQSDMQATCNRSMYSNLGCFRVLQDSRKSRDPSAGGGSQTDTEDAPDRTQADAPAAAAAAVSEKSPAAAAAASDGTAVMGKRPKPDLWWRNSFISCCLRQDCPSTRRSHVNNNIIYKKMSVQSVVKQQLLCTDCCNVFCGDCKAAHDSAACANMHKGYITEQLLLAAVSKTMSTWWLSRWCSAVSSPSHVSFCQSAPCCALAALS